MTSRDEVYRLDAAAPVATPGRLRSAVLVSAVAALLVFPQLGQHPIAKSDSARMLLLARDMVERGVWFEARVEGQHYRNKPPLYPWTIAALSLPSGRVTETTAHVPVAAAAVAAVLFTFLLGDSLFGRRAGLWAGLVLATSFGFFSHSQTLLPDMLMLAFDTAALYAFWRGAGERPEQPALVGFYAALGCAVFAKGPAGLLPVLVVASWVWSERGPRGFGRLWSPVGFGVFTAVTLIWLAPFVGAGGRSFGRTVVWEDWLSWYLAWPDPSRVAKFLLDMLVGFLPWSFLLPLGLVHALRSRAHPAARFALLSLAIPLIVIVLARNRLQKYLLPIYPGAALLVAWWADAEGSRRSALGTAVAWLSLLGIGATVAILPGIEEVRESEFFLVPGFSWKVLPLLVGALLLGALLFWALRMARSALLVYGVAALMGILLTYGARLNDEWMLRTQNFRNVAATLERHAGGVEARVFAGSLLLPVDYYIGRQLVRMATVQELNSYLAGPDRPIALIDERYWKRFRPVLGPDIRVLETMRVYGVDLFIVRLAPR